MAAISNEYQKAVLDHLQDYSDISKPVKSSLRARLLIHYASPDDLHPNPEDEFCDPNIGPNDSIIAKYKNKLSLADSATIKEYMEPITVEKLSSGGYRILNGHHRWMAAKAMHMERVPIEIVNSMHIEDIIAEINELQGEMSVSFDLDEVLMCDAAKYPADKLAFPLNIAFPETIRKNTGLLITSLKELGFDVWVYTGTYRSAQYIRTMLGRHHAPVDGIINGIKTKRPSSGLSDAFRKKYRISVNVDNDCIIWINTKTKEFEIIDVRSDSRWANSVSSTIKKQLRREAR